MNHNTYFYLIKIKPIKLISFKLSNIIDALEPLHTLKTIVAISDRIHFHWGYYQSEQELYENLQALIDLGIVKSLTINEDIIKHIEKLQPLI